MPSGRAILGGLLVTAAAVGVAATTTAAGDPPGVMVVVAAEPVDPGSVIPAAAVRLDRVDLPAASAARTFADPDEVVGGVALAPLEPGELVQRSAVLAGDRPTTGGRVVSFALDRPRALNGELRRGEQVDVLATYGTGGDATTAVVAAGAVVHAVDTAGITVVRSAGAGADPLPDRYRSPGP